MPGPTIERTFLAGIERCPRAMRSTRSRFLVYACYLGSEVLLPQVCHRQTGAVATDIERGRPV